jgi:hypothetical protein
MQEATISNLKQQQPHSDMPTQVKEVSIKRSSSVSSWVEIKRPSNKKHASKGNKNLEWEIIGKDELIAQGWENGKAKSQCRVS